MGDERASELGAGVARQGIGRQDGMPGKKKKQGERDEEPVRGRWGRGLQLFLRGYL